MKFRIREGFKLFSDLGEAWSYEAGGPNSGVIPLAVGGQVREFTREHLGSIARAGGLGKLEPIDAEAVKYFGDTQPIVPRAVTHPELFARPAPEPERSSNDFRYL